MKIIDTKDKLLDWNEYREYLKIELKKLASGEPYQIFVSKDKLDFNVDGAKWKGHAVLSGPKAIMSVRKLKAQGVIFREATVNREGKNLNVGEMIPKLEKEAKKTFLKLKLGYKILGADGPEEAQAESMEEEEEIQASSDSSGGQAEEQLKRIKKELANDIRSAVQGDAPNKAAIANLMREATQAENQSNFEEAVAKFEEIRGQLGEAGGDLAEQAKKIETAVKVWNKTEEAATKELRKLQKAILDLDDPRSRPVIQGLESILTRLDKVDDEAKEAADAAAAGDHAGFVAARQDFMNKMNSILTYVNNDELIRDADNNPAVNIDIAGTITNSLNRLMAAV